MNQQKLKLSAILFALGLLGVLSLLTMDMPLSPEIEAILNEKFSPGQIELLLLINPAILLIIAVILGVVFHDKVNLKVPIIENLINKNENEINAKDILKYGMAGGVIAGVLLSLTGLIFYPNLPQEFMELGENLKLSLAARFLYGGITEEIITRFGLMSFVIWLFSKIIKGESNCVYWIGILVAAIIFAFAHFPVAYQAVEQPSTLLLTYIVIGNSIGGIIFGWLYWKKGLESAFIAHIFTHVIMVLAEPFLNG